MGTLVKKNHVFFMPHTFSQSKHPFSQCKHFNQIEPFFKIMISYSIWFWGKKIIL